MITASIAVGVPTMERSRGAHGVGEGSEACVAYASARQLQLRQLWHHAIAQRDCNLHLQAERRASGNRVGDGALAAHVAVAKVLARLRVLLSTCASFFESSQLCSRSPRRRNSPHSATCQPSL